MRQGAEAARDAADPNPRNPEGAGRSWTALGLIATLSLTLNLVGMTWGLPERWHPDEKADVVATMVAESSLAPESFINPALPLYVMWPLVWAQDRAASAGLLSGVVSDPLWLARALSAFAGAALSSISGFAGSMACIKSRCSRRMASIRLTSASMSPCLDSPS